MKTVRGEGGIRCRIDGFIIAIEVVEIEAEGVAAYILVDAAYFAITPIW